MTRRDDYGALGAPFELEGRQMEMQVEAIENGAETRTYSIEEFARLAGISRNLAYDAAKRGEIRTLKFGRTLRVPRNWGDRFLAEGHYETREGPLVVE